MKKILALCSLLFAVMLGAVMASAVPTYPQLKKDSLQMRNWPIQDVTTIGAHTFGYIATPGNTPVPGVTGSFTFNDASPTPTPHTITIKGGVVISIT